MFGRKHTLLIYNILILIYLSSHINWFILIIIHIIPLLKKKKSRCLVCRVNRYSTGKGRTKRICCFYLFVYVIHLLFSLRELDMARRKLVISLFRSTCWQHCVNNCTIINGNKNDSSTNCNNYIKMKYCEGWEMRSPIGSITASFSRIIYKGNKTESQYWCDINSQTSV